MRSAVPAIAAKQAVPMPELRRLGSLSPAYLEGATRPCDSH
jgi:hypothetical protein